MSIRHRVTILNHESSHDNVLQHVDPSRVVLNDVDYTREDKYTVNMKNQFLKSVKHLRITVGSFESPVFHYNSNHLNIYAVPNTSNRDLFYQEINGFINRVFGTDVDSPQWIKSKDSLFLHLQDYNLDNFKKLMGQMAHDVVDSDIIDFNYQQEPKNQVVFTYINPQKTPIEHSASSEIFTEVGLFLIDPNSTDNDVILAGSRIIMGAPQDEYFVKTLFHIKPKYRLLPEGTHEVLANGLHPKIKTSVSPDIPNDEDIIDCKLYYYLQLNKSLFIDKYNLGENFDLVVNLGTNDLELPEYKLHEWGNEILLEIKDHSKPIELNLHSRYQRPSNTDQTKKTIVFDNPRVFYGCEDVSDRNILSYNPFLNDMTIKNNYEKFFTNKTIFYESFPPTNQLSVDIPIPRAKFESINAVTASTIVIGIVIIVLQIFKVSLFKSTTKDRKLNKKMQ